MSTVPIPKILANFETSLAATMSASATTLTLNRSTDGDGNTLSGLYSLTFDEGTTSEEHMTVTLTGASGVVSKRGLSRVDGFTEVSGNKYRHERGASVKITSFALLNIQRLLNGTDTFNSVDLAGINSITGLATPTSGETTKAANVAYVNAVSVAGASDASETVKGIVEMGTAAQATAGTATGETGAPITLTPARIAAQIQSGSWLYAVEDGTGSDDTYTATLTPALTAYTAGQVFFVKLTVANTGACTINFNGLGAKNIKKYASGAQADPETGDIVANMPCIFLYDGTSMILMNPGAAMPTTAIMQEMATFFGSTDITGAEAETLTSGSTSDASSKHTHLAIANSKHINIAYPAPSLSGSVVAISSRRSSSGEDYVFVAGCNSGVGGGYMTGMYQGTNGQASVIASASKDIYLYEEIDRRTVASVDLSPGGVVYKVGGGCYASETTTSGGDVYYNGSSCSFSSNACRGALAYDNFFDYLLICNSTTTVRRFSGAGTTSLTYVDTITLSSAVDVDKGFFYKGTNQSFFFLSGTTIKEFNSSGTLQNTYTHGITSAMLIGVVGIGGVIYLAFSEGRGATDASSEPDISMLSIRLLPTTITY